MAFFTVQLLRKQQVAGSIPATGSIGDHVENHRSRPSENKDECAEKFRERCFL